jgi:hypothetical protein
MIALNEMFFYAMHNWGEKTPRSTYDVSGTKDFSDMNDSNILVRDEGIETFNTEKVRAKE